MKNALFVSLIIVGIVACSSQKNIEKPDSRAIVSYLANKKVFVRLALANTVNPLYVQLYDSLVAQAINNLPEAMKVTVPDSFSTLNEADRIRAAYRGLKQTYPNIDWNWGLWNGFIDGDDSRRNAEGMTYTVGVYSLGFDHSGGAVPLSLFILALEQYPGLVYQLFRGNTYYVKGTVFTDQHASDEYKYVYVGIYTRKGITTEKWYVSFFGTLAQKDTNAIVPVFKMK